MMHVTPTVLYIVLCLSVPSYAAQPGASRPSSWPTAPLQWGDINFLHTTDTHGWLMGHTKASEPEPNYSADFGDFLSFVTHMREMADEKGVDLLLVDSGDVHDGTGITDGSPIGNVNAHESNELIKRLPYDILAIGNHELYNYSCALDTYQNFAPHWHGGYLASNVDLTLLHSSNSTKAQSVPLGHRYRKFRTKQGRKVTAFGVLHNFAGFAKNGTFVQHVEDMVRESWFLEAVQDEPDLFLLAGHMPVHSDPEPEVDVNDWPLVFDTIRAVHPNTPIFIFGGHSHNRNCTQLDRRSISFQGGRYMETVGWLSANLTNGVLPVSRRYLDANRNTYMYHSSLDHRTFDTAAGLRLSSDITELVTAWDLFEIYGYSPQDYYLDRVDHPNNHSIITLFLMEVLPTMLSLGQADRAHVPRKIIINRGTLRFDVYKGPFTKNDQYTVLPFTNDFLYLSVPWSVGRKAVDTLNLKRGSIARIRHSKRAAAGLPLAAQNVDRSQLIMESLHSYLTLGYVTDDDCPGFGDDTRHLDIGAHNRDDSFIGSPDPDVGDTDLVDLIFLSFIRGSVLSVINELDVNNTYTESDVLRYSQYKANNIFAAFAKYAWN